MYNTTVNKYEITFGNHTEQVSEQGLLNFVKIAVIQNKDISNFNVKRIK